MKHSPANRKVTGSLLYWNYFLAIEQDVVTLSRYVELCEDNYDTYSTELGGIIMAATQENDVLIKQIVGNNCEKEAQYRREIRQNFPAIIQREVEIPRFNLKFKPFEDWGNNKTPEWWTANNKFKHERDSKYDRASLKNALNSVAGLLISNIYYYSSVNRLSEIQPISQLFTPVGLLKYVEFTTTGVAPCFEI